VRNPTRRTALLLAIPLTFGVAACGSDDDSGDAGGGGSASSAARASATPGTEIEIRNFAYEPEALEARVGDTITVTNHDDTDHTVTADDGPIDTGDVAGDGTATFELTEVGEIPYHCDIHNYMTGTIRVTE
jgi:plastocyanin